MKIIVDEMPKQPKDCPYSRTDSLGSSWCNYRKNEVLEKCNYVDECKWFVVDKTNKNLKGQKNE